MCRGRGWCRYDPFFLQHAHDGGADGCLGDVVVGGEVDYRGDLAG